MCHDIGFRKRDPSEAQRDHGYTDRSEKRGGHRSASVMKINNSERQIKLRRYQNTLIIVGIGTIVFNVWTVIKCIGIALLRRDVIIGEYRKTVTGQDLGDVSDSFMFIIIVIALALILLLDLLIRIYIATAAISEARGTRKRKNGFYIIVIAIMVIFAILSVIQSVIGARSSNDEAALLFGDNTSLSAIIIEITSMMMLIEMMHSSIMVRRYNRLGKHSKVK